MGILGVYHVRREVLTGSAGVQRTTTGGEVLTVISLSRWKACRMRWLRRALRRYRILSLSVPPSAARGMRRANETIPALDDWEAYCEECGAFREVRRAEEWDAKTGAPYS